MTNSHPQITHTLYIDPYPAAECLEAELSDYMMPGDHAPANIHNGNWYDQRGQAVSSGPTNTHTHLFRRERVTQSQPQRGIAMVGDTIAWVLNSMALWKTPLSQQPQDDVCSLFAPPGHQRRAAELPMSTPLRGYFQASLDPKLDYRNNDQILDRATDLLLDIRMQVVNFVGADRWVMHFYGFHGRDFVVEKTVDFRVYDWERRMLSGEWK